MLIKNHQANGNQIELKDIYNWTIQAIQGLQVLHSIKIIHRDIKPDNIFLSKENTIKLGDLGIAKTLDQTSKYSGKFSIIGTFSYMSPEILNSETYSFNTDIWSLGCVVYELHFLKVAFKSLNSAIRNVENLDLNDSWLTNLIKKYVFTIVVV